MWSEGLDWVHFLWGPTLNIGENTNPTSFVHLCFVVQINQQPALNVLGLPFLIFLHIVWIGLSVDEPSVMKIEDFNTKYVLFSEKMYISVENEKCYVESQIYLWRKMIDITSIASSDRLDYVGWEFRFGAVVLHLTYSMDYME